MSKFSQLRLQLSFCSCLLLLSLSVSSCSSQMKLKRSVTDTTHVDMEYVKTSSFLDSTRLNGLFTATISTVEEHYQIDRETGENVLESKKTTTVNLKQETEESRVIQSNDSIDAHAFIDQSSSSDTDTLVEVEETAITGMAKGVKIGIIIGIVILVLIIGNKIK